MRWTTLLLPLAMLAVAVPATAGEFRCENQPEILISVDRPDAVDEICRAAESSIRFLARFGLHPQRDIPFRVVEQPLASEGYDAYGRYDSRSDGIELMSYPAITRLNAAPEMYDEPFDRVHYAGAVAHEVAHAVMQHNLMTRLISPAPQEYLAHAAQLAAMPAERRERIIRAMDVGPWEPGDAISDIYMALQPGKFAVKSYTHLTSLKHPEAFVRILLNANWFYVYVPGEELPKSH